MDSEAICEAVKTNPAASTRRFNIPLRQLFLIFTFLARSMDGVEKRPKKWQKVQAKRHVNTCRKLLENPRHGCFIIELQLGSLEVRVHFSSPNKKNGSVPEQMAKPIAKPSRFSRKALLCAWRNYEGVIHFELVPDIRYIKADL